MIRVLRLFKDNLLTNDFCYVLLLVAQDWIIWIILYAHINKGIFFFADNLA